ncbi:MAG: hypothetical protein A3D65_06325 [Candidatus Lloydbacteria bacterium RIFCSPHIGHO2_02_FULL_50_13]|uniref:Uncharacterized protein n=1 Tax=Candidatus Lloydbacteria bacterium RIFCSPHIGHO2_02_FULL_50_13 TaxID=1798661 RepID=A0A1G2D1P7_9BACT|nr:MAG: hypothetical protein A3D65_06325 [Candidatus Lloydbacteria bacterium RIFCSPHIGHO2_02_FULL_50_13]
MRLDRLKQRKLHELREKFLGALNLGGGARVSHRSEYFKFDERKATLLTDTLSVVTEPLSDNEPPLVLSVLDKVTINPLRVTKWGMWTASAEAQRDTVSFGESAFRVVAFVELSGTVLDNKMCCKGIFCVLAELVLDGFDEGMVRYKSQICCSETINFHHAMGKVLLYPIECLVPVPTTTEGVSLWPPKHVGPGSVC